MPPVGLKQSSHALKPAGSLRPTPKLKKPKKFKDTTPKVIDIMKPDHNKVKLQLKYTKVHNFKIPSYLGKLSHLWSNWAKSIWLEGNRTCPHQTLKDPAFQLLHQTRKQELLLRLILAWMFNTSGLDELFQILNSIKGLKGFKPRQSQWSNTTQ